MTRIVQSQMEKDLAAARSRAAQLAEELAISEAERVELSEYVGEMEERLDELDTDACRAIREFFQEIKRPVGTLTFVLEDTPAVQRALLALFRAAEPS